MSDSDDIRKDLAYIRNRVDQIYEKVGNHETRLTVLEQEMKHLPMLPSPPPHQEIPDQSSHDGSRLVLIIAMAAIVVSLLSFLYRVLFS